ncbi:hypothetical protein [Secundilactobacillus folii]|uniref:Uncharacterized protein n=1 Tax=Secundilactobacillus folii TaxID=2678357 RepID=A0A7X2XUC6_9LACO|nr:hypothetical protein [Secundilactobacillus folii]MTV81695.1 hypothetical protein [Secundilactobacillus folii]
MPENTSMTVANSIPANGGIINQTKVADRIIVDLRYATTDSFTAQNIHGQQR